MFKKLMVSSTMILALSSGATFAYNGNYGVYYNECGPCHNGNHGMSSSRCGTPIWCNFDPSTYIGVSVGIRDNYSSNPTHFTGLDFANVSLGYGGICSSNFYFASEIFGLGTINLSDYTNNGNGAATTWGLGASILPGLAITHNAVVFSRLGVVYSRFSDQGANRGGWQLGLGTEIALCPTLGLRGEFVHTWYNGVSGLSSAQSNIFNVGLVYRFM